jgi:PKD repeat protein
MDSILFSAIVVDADRIDWDFGDLGTSTAYNLKYAYSQAGNYQVFATITDTAENLSYSFELDNNIEVYSLPVIDLGESVDLCAGEETSISGPAGMNAYTWSNGGNDQSIIVHSGGRYYLVVEDANSCLAQDSVDVTIRALPVIDIGEDISILENESETVNAGEGFTSYTWNDIAGSNLYTVSGADLGLGEHILRVEVENEFGCTNSDTIQITVSAIDALGALVSVEFRLYPNPVTDVVRIVWDRNLAEALQITIVDLGGKPMISGMLRESGEEINVTGLKAGSYYLIMKTGSETKTLPLIKI